MGVRTRAVQLSRRWERKKSQSITVSRDRYYERSGVIGSYFFFFLAHEMVVYLRLPGSSPSQSFSYIVLSALVLWILLTGMPMPVSTWSEAALRERLGTYIPIYRHYHHHHHYHHVGTRVESTWVDGRASGYPSSLSLFLHLPNYSLSRSFIFYEIAIPGVYQHSLLKM